MSLPTLEKSWQFSINNIARPSTVSLTNIRTLMIGIKNELIGFGVSPWTVWGACDGAGNFGNGDSIDRWADIGDLVWAAVGSNHSWIVLSQSGIGGNAAICIDLSNATSTSITLVLSPSAGFGVANGGADGTALSRPTATDEVIMINNTNWGPVAAATAGLRYIYHLIQSTDGKCTRVFILYDNYLKAAWIIDVADSEIAAWNLPVFGMAGWILNGTMGLGTMSVIATPLGVTKVGAASASLVMTLEAPMTDLGYVTAAGYDDNTLENPFLGIGLYCTTAGHRGIKGRIVDLWFNGELVLYGHPYPDDGSYQFVSFGHFIIPWNGTQKVFIA